MYASPLELVAVKVRAPTVEAPMQTVSAECSDSTGTNSAGELAGLDPRRELLDDRRLRGDRVGGDDLHAGELGRLAAASLPVMTVVSLTGPSSPSASPARRRRARTRATMTMAPAGHSSAQMPQPLQ